MPVVEVALPLPVPRTWSYRVPPEWAARAVPGARVLVPFGRGERIGWIVACDDLGASAAGDAKLRDLGAVLDEVPTVPPALLDICRWIADYYLAPLGQVLRTALPAVLTDRSTETVRLVDAQVPGEVLTPNEERVVAWLREQGEPRPVARLQREMGTGAWWPAIHALRERGIVRVSTEPPRVQPAVRTRRVLHLARALPSLAERDRVFGRARRQRECWESVEAMGGSAETVHLTGQLGYSHTVLNGLVQRGVARIEAEEVARDPYAGMARAPEPSHQPTPRQAEVIRELREAACTAQPETYLLHGVTGSGKTLVYVELLREVVERQGRTAIVLVPEIALTPQTVGRFKASFGDRVAVLHSALSDGERYDEWRRLRSGEKRIVVGARSAIFAPLPDLGAVVVDEEHEGSYKQGEAPRYHAREVAVVRAHAAGAVCVLGSATPALESWENARRGKYRLLELPERVEGRPLPAVRVVDLRAEGRIRREQGGGGGVPILSAELEGAVRERIRRGEQTILLLNRRGYATFVQCRECGQVWHCPRCNVSLTFHKRRNRLVCHHCLHEEAAPLRCSACGAEDLSFRGVGTEQVERAVAEAFPSARLARMDVDTTSGKWAHHRILDRVGRGEVDILLGTQMIAKGLDFHAVTLVGVVNADVGINLPDFRATERTFQLLTQVAGRAGRGSRGGEVVIQTALPDHYAIRCATEHDFVGFAERELAERREPCYPPFCRLLNVVVSGVQEVPAQEAAERAAQWLRGLLDTREVGGIELVGPAPCPIDRLRGRWRWHFLVRGEDARTLGEVARFFAHRFRLAPGPHDLRLALDRDPVSLL